MDFDRELLVQASRGIASIRTYNWDQPWVTLGRFQDPKSALVGADVPFSIRPTGGSAVLHGHDVTVSIALPVPWLGFGRTRSVREAYRAVTKPILLSLQSCGVAAVLAEDAGFIESNRIADCFASKSRNDIISLESGSKICGCAQVLDRQGYLLQASIPYEEPDEVPSSWIKDYSILPIAPWNYLEFPEKFFSIFESWVMEMVGNLES